MDRLVRRKHHGQVVARLRTIMARHGLDAMVAFTIENYTYLNAAPSLMLGSFNIPGLAMVLVPAEGDVEGICSDFERPAQETEGAITTWHDFPMWVYVDDQFVPAGRRTPPRRRTEHVDSSLSLGLLSERIQEAGAHRGRIGLDMCGLDPPSHQRLCSMLPQAEFVDATGMFYEGRAHKTEYEVECLRYGAARQEEVIFDILPGVKTGLTHAELMARLRSRILSTPGLDGIRYLGVSLGPHFAPTYVPYSAVVHPGALIKYDGVVEVRGYGADQARTFVVGRPSDTQRRISDALLAAHREALDMIQPGAVPREIFEKTIRTVQRLGLPDYRRGHIGHSLGLDRKVEEPPFLSSANETPLAPGQVFCLELPYYAHGFGSIMCEDIVLLTETGAECLTQADRRLFVIEG